MPEIGRLLTAMATPFDAAGRVDYARARQLAEALVASGSEGLVVAGTTGESPTLTRDEKLRLFGEVREAVGDRAAVIAGTCNYCTAESIELSREAAEIGVTGILGPVPYYNKPPQEGLYAHFKAIAEAVPLPLILYNIPSRSATNMVPATTIRLSVIDNIVGVKEASGDLEAIGQIIDGTRPDFRVWSGNDADTLPLLAIGGYGVISVTSHLVGRQIRQMIDRFLAGDVATAAAIHRRLLPLTRACFVTTSPSPLKYALGRVGFPVGGLRLPLVEVDERSAAVMDSALAPLTIDLPVGAAV
ncbi:MAG TPA: 4-hydroxy-tetrahydrodipicolinate synthase [Chloroflexota bacterium]|nr:4-hydroxy-tetrahydrodipicolinate synthase [Chloroflexota bacterium]